MENIITLDDFIRSDYFESYEESWRSNLFCSSFNNDLIDRIEKAAEFGSDGRTHSEVLELWQEAVNCCHDDDVISWDIKESIIIEICDCILWHSENGSLHEELG